MELREIRERAEIATRSLAVSEREAQRAITDRVLLLEAIDRLTRTTELQAERIHGVRHELDLAENFMARGGQFGLQGQLLIDALRKIVGPR